MRISLGILLGSTYLSRRVGFSPRELFTAGEPGLWVDPSDVANLNWRRNLLTFSEQFDNAAWAKTGAPLAVITQNIAVAPDGTTTADLLVANAGRVQQTLTLETGNYVLSCYMKANGGSTGELWLSGATGRASFNLSNGTVSSTSSGSASIQSVGNGWYRCIVTGTSASGSQSIIIDEAGSGIFIWGAQLEVGSTATEYQPITDLNTEVRTQFPSATLFQDTTGTTPVTTPGQTVALALDRSQGLVLGPERVIDVAAQFDPFNANSTLISENATSISVENSTVAQFGITAPALTAVVGVANRLTVTLNSNATRSCSVAYGATTVNVVLVANVPQTLTFILIPTFTTALRVTIATTSVGDRLTVSNPSLKELLGNHLTQATAASRPVYGIEPAGGRRNLLTFTEQFDNAAWAVGSVTPTANTVVSPDGTTTADTLAFIASANSRIFQTITTAAISYTFSVWLRSDAPQTLRIGIPLGSTSNMSVTTEWTRFSYTFTPSAGSNVIGIQNALDGLARSVYAWGAQLETGSTATNYQRVTTAFDVTEAGKPSTHYLQFDGTDDWMISPTVAPGTDKAQVFAGVRKLSDANGTIVESSINSGSNSGSFGLFGGGYGGAAAAYAANLFGSQRTSFDCTTFTAPTTNILSSVFDIAGASRIDEIQFRVNGAIPTLTGSGNANAGTGNFLAYPLYIGRRGGTLQPFNGRIYQLIVRFGPNLDSEKLNLTELFVGTKTGFYKPTITGIPTWQ